jgi:hypothetical protein
MAENSENSKGNPMKLLASTALFVTFISTAAGA